jgi:hypothetical protein
MNTCPSSPVYDRKDPQVIVCENERNNEQAGDHLGGLPARVPGEKTGGEVPTSGPSMAPPPLGGGSSPHQRRVGPRWAHPGPGRGAPVGGVIEQRKPWREAPLLYNGYR